MSSQPLTSRAHGIPYTRAASALRFVAFLNRIGAPTERYLRQARIPLASLDDPETPLPLHFCYRFCEIAVRQEGIQDLGLLVAQHTSVQDLGRYGQALGQSLTVFDYLSTGINLLDRFTSGEYLRLEGQDGTLRLYHVVPRGSIAASNQSDLFALMLTINTLRSAVGNSWYPEELHIPGVPADKLRNVEALANTRIVDTHGPAYFTLPRAILERPFRPAKHHSSFSADETTNHPAKLPGDFFDSLSRLVELLLPSGGPGIDLAAEAAGASKRTLQRYLAESGVSYSQLVENTRMRLACRWLETTDMTVVDIAHALGYADTSNFTRAFRRRTGIPPQRYRAQARGD
jgi:AraC-like DNA-binding protein